MQEPPAPSTRSTDVQSAYDKFRANWPQTMCVFCDKTQIIVDKKSYVTIIKNEFPYIKFDGQTVIDHLLVIPHRHVETLDELDAAESLELFDLLKSYESRGYSFYGRAANNSVRTVGHSHIHLFKLVID